MEARDDGVFQHDEADVTMVSYVLKAARRGKEVIRVLSDDTDVFALLVYWVYRAEVQCKVQMERWDGTVLDINATCNRLGMKCLQLIGMHALTECDTTSYLFGKGKVTALHTLLSGEFPGLANVLGEVGITQAELLEAGKPFIVALYGQAPGISMETARFKLFTKKKKGPKVMSLPPTSANLLQHLLRAHLQVMLWKAADQLEPSQESECITNFGWKIQDGIPIPVIAQGDSAHPELIDVICCQCKAKDTMCSTEACSCNKQHLGCTSYGNCSGEVGYCNPYTLNPEDDVDIEEENEENGEVVVANEEGRENIESELYDNEYMDSDDEWLMK